ncbi:MAG: GNAT family acetyltransferase [Lachnospiraceae bacterium]|nr:GNAT family acetyltransferase [Lachnospiraceae bacterium]
MKYLSKDCIPNHNYFTFKQPFLGSHQKMRYRIVCEPPGQEGGEQQYLAVTYPDEFCFEKTAEEKKIFQRFPFTEQGRETVMEWLDSQYGEVYL